jgi:TM2 domain-containing membrane protein YozV
VSALGSGGWAGPGVARRLAAAIALLLTGAVRPARAEPPAQVPPPENATAETARPAPLPPAAPGPASSSLPTPSYLELADRLRGAGSYSECAVEALRHAYQHPAERQRGFDRAALCLSLAGRFDDAHRLMLALPSAGEPLDARGRLRVCLTEVFMTDLGAPACPDLVRSASRSASGDREDALGRYTLTMRAMHARRWQEARVSRATAGSTSGAGDQMLAAWQERDQGWLNRYDALPSKSPLLAGALSAVVPGLGRVYIGRWQDGLISFLLVGLSAVLSAQGFYDEGSHSVRGWIVGSAGALLYVGNVYGSAVGAVVQRRDAEEALSQEVDREYRRRLEP